MAAHDDGDALDVAAVLAAQRTYYELRAPDYLAVAPSDRSATDAMPLDLLRSVVEGLGPLGDVLELACGPGTFTAELARRATSVTAVDGSATMLARNRATVGDRSVRYVEADLFAWEPMDRYDLVFFGFWLSHVPPDVFGDFWALVERCLRPGGRAVFVDEDDRAREAPDAFVVDGVPLARRTLRDGRAFDIVKAFWRPTDLAAELQALGWRAEVAPIGSSFLVGEARRAGR